MLCSTATARQVEICHLPRNCLTREMALVLHLRNLICWNPNGNVLHCCRVSGEQLASLASQMLRLCQQRNSGIEQLSYNVVLTSEYLQMVPRRIETSGEVSVNALGAAGTIFVKKQEQLKYLEERTPGRVLADVGFAW